MKTKNMSKLVLKEIILLVFMLFIGTYMTAFTTTSAAFTPPFLSNSGLWLVVVHSLLGFVTIAIAVALFMEFLRRDSRALLMYSFVGLAALLLDFAGGVSFVFGGANVFFVFLKAECFIAAFISYLLMFLILRYAKLK
jgi:hypothetical protein